MGLQDKSIQCYDCGVTFTFSAKEQEFYSLKGYTNVPKRCPACRQARKQRQESDSYRNSGSSYQPPRQMYPATCAHCGKATQVPFEPRSGRPVYCRDCYSTVTLSR